MSVTFIVLILLIVGYAGFLFFDGFIQERHAGKTLVAVRLQRRIADNFFLLCILLVGIYYEVTHGSSQKEIIALCLLSSLVLWQTLRYPKWRLKWEGFIFGGRYWKYEVITAMRLSEDGVLVLDLKNGQSLTLPVAKIEDLEKAAAFFTDADTLQHLFQRGEENVQN